jgi:DNA-binding NtrC family response regulator
MSQPSAEPAAGTNALVVDDDEFMRATMVRQLKAAGVARIEAAHDWRAARVLLDRHPSCNLVLSDLDMPGAEGSAFLEELATLRPGIALIIASALEPLVLKAVEKQARRLKLRVLGVVRKPTSVELLRELIARDHGS